MSADTANAVTAPARTVEAADDAVLRLVEVVLTAEVYNQHPNLDLNDLPPHCREVFGVAGATEAKRPVAVSEAMIKKALGIPDAAERLKKNPFVSYEEFGQRLRVTALAEAARLVRAAGRGPADPREPDPRLVLRAARAHRGDQLRRCAHEEPEVRGDQGLPRPQGLDAPRRGRAHALGPRPLHRLGPRGDPETGRGPRPDRGADRRRSRRSRSRSRTSPTCAPTTSPRSASSSSSARPARARPRSRSRCRTCSACRSSRSGSR